MLSELLMARETGQGPRNQKIFEFSAEVGRRLEERRKSTDVPVSAQIRRAVERYVETPHDLKHRLLITDRESRKPATIPPELWESLKDRKKKTRLDLNEQVQIAVTLYLDNVDQADGQESAATVPGDLENKSAPLDREQLRDMLREELEGLGISVQPATPALLQQSRLVPITMAVNCGDGDDLDNVVELLGDDGMAEVTGRLAEKVTQNSFVARASGWSMSSDNLPEDIKPGDLLLMTPLDEFTGVIRRGTVILARVWFKDGRTVQTLKAYEGRALKANNEAFKDIPFKSPVTRAETVAVCRGVLEKVFN